MKKTYVAPRVILVDFAYDENIVAQSVPEYSPFGDPDHLTGRCRYNSGTCTFFYTADQSLGCQWEDAVPMSL